MMFIQVDDEIINLDFVARFVFTEHKYTYVPQCVIFLKDGERREIQGDDEVRRIKDLLRLTAVVVIVEEVTRY